MSNSRKLRGKDWEPLSREIDHLFDGREEQLVTEINRIAPGFLDQVQAASAQGGRTFNEFLDNARAGIPANRLHESEPGETPPQILHQIKGLYLRVITELASGQRASCGHVSIDSPAPYVAPVYSGTVYCHRCFTAGGVKRPDLTEREEHTCDLCGIYRARQTMHGLNAQVGPAMLIIGICPQCSRELERGTS